MLTAFCPSLGNGVGLPLAAGAASAAGCPDTAESGTVMGSAALYAGRSSSPLSTARCVSWSTGLFAAPGRCRSCIPAPGMLSGSNSPLSQQHSHRQILSQHVQFAPQLSVGGNKRDATCQHVLPTFHHQHDRRSQDALSPKYCQKAPKMAAQHPPPAAAPKSSAMMMIADDERGSRSECPLCNSPGAAWLVSASTQ